MSAFIELKRCTGHEIFAVPYRGGLPLRPVRVPDGTIVESLSAEGRRELPRETPSCFEVGHGGVPATWHHASLGLVIAHLPISGIFEFLDGRVVAIYGAEAVPIAARRASVG